MWLRGYNIRETAHTVDEATEIAEFLAIQDDCLGVRIRTRDDQIHIDSLHSDHNTHGNKPPDGMHHVHFREHDLRGLYMLTRRGHELLETVRAQVIQDMLDRSVVETAEDAEFMLSVQAVR